MDYERAERHLRLVSDRALRHAGSYLKAAADAPADGTGAHVADALTAVGAIDEERADAIMIQLAQALAVRSATDAALLPRDVHRLTGRHHPNQAAQNQPAAAVELRVAPVGRLVHLRYEGMPAELYLMAVVVTAGMTTLTMTMHVRRPAGPADIPVLPSERPFPQSLTLTDDRAATYGLSFSGMPGPEDWDGFLDVDPAPRAPGPDG